MHCSYNTMMDPVLASSILIKRAPANEQADGLVWSVTGPTRHEQPAGHKTEKKCALKSSCILQK